MNATTSSNGERGSMSFTFFRFENMGPSHDDERIYFDI